MLVQAHPAGFHPAALYLKAAALWLHGKLGVTIHIVCPQTQKILPPFRDPIAQAFKWGSPEAK